MDNSIVEEFLKGFSETRFPKAFTDGYEAMECLSRGLRYETLLIKDRISGELLVGKCYEKSHPLYDTTEPVKLRNLFYPGLPAFVEEIVSSEMRCIIREYIEGKTLWEQSGEGLFKPEEVRRAGLGLCKILGFLHRQTPPVIYRDIKPQNIVIKNDGSLSLIDLGISRLYVEGARADTVFCGTQSFAPPEQYGFMQTDARSDIYSLGVLLTWMLTGNPDKIDDPKTSLERVIVKCTAFAPEKRFRNITAVENALLRIEPGNIVKKRIILCAGALLVTAVVIYGGHRQIPVSIGNGLASAPGIVMQSSPAVNIPDAIFAEPLVEQAVRLMLDKEPQDTLSSEELARVTELFITRDTPCKDIMSFYHTHEEQNKNRFYETGPIMTLKDMALLPNLRTLCLASQQIKEVTEIANLPHLFQLELRCNDVSDISPLSGLKELAMVGLNSNPVKDISPLASCKSINLLDLHGASNYDGKALALFGDFSFLDISNDTDSYRYLGGKSIGELKIAKTSLEDLTLLSNVGGIRRLELFWSPIKDLSGLEEHREITYLDITGVPAEDFSVLIKLPELKEVVVSTGAKGNIERTAEEGAFTVTYK